MKNKQTKIALMVQNLEEVYHIPIWNGIKEAIGDQNVSLICFNGGVLERDCYYEFESRRNIIYDLMKPGDFDGIIAVTSSIGVEIGPKGTKKFLSRYHPIPIVSIGMKIEGYPSIVVDNEKGIETIIEHLVNSHHHKRIAYINGPEKHFEAALRFAGYKNALKKVGLPYDPKLVVHSNFLDGAGPVKKMLDERKARFDAIIGANDTMAYSAIKECQSRGLEIPKDVAVIGFDDGIFASYSYPPLTSVRQPLNLLGSHAYKTLVKKIKGQKTNNLTTLPVELKTRRSCGCISKIPSGLTCANGKLISKTPDRTTYKTVIHFLESHGSTIQNDMTKAFKKANVTTSEDVTQFIQQIFKAFILDLQGHNQAVIFAFDKRIKQGDISPNHFKAWQLIISILRQYTMRFPCNSKEIYILENIWAQTSELIKEIQEQGRVYDYYIGSSNMYIIRQAGYAIYNSFKLNELLQTIDKVLTRLNHKTFFLVLFDKKDKKSNEESITNHRLIIAKRHGQYIPIPEDGLPFDKQLFLPSEMLDSTQQTHLYTETLYFRDNLIGYQILDIFESGKIFYEWLRLQISGALQGALLLQERKQAELKLEKANKRLSEANRRLQERNKELDAFSHTVAHDLKNPLSGLTSLAWLVRRKFNEWPKDKIQSRLQDILESGEMLAKIIDELLLLSQVRESKDISFHPVDMVMLIQNVEKRVRLLTVSKKGSIIYPKSFPLANGYGPWIEEILANYVSNALKYGGSPPIIYIGADQHKDYIRYWVKDNGRGIQKEIQPRLFVAFTKLASVRSEGSGLGLSIVQRIADKLDGAVGFETSPTGSTFYFDLKPFQNPES